MTKTTFYTFLLIHSSKNLFKYEKDGFTYYECHVDTHPSFQKKCDHLPFGGNLSVRFPMNEKPIIIFGQDECIFKQYAFTKKSWTSPDGTRPLIPKDEGQGLMLSSFVSREFGYGYDISNEILSKINEEMRGQNNHYSDEDAAKIINGFTWKPKLKTSPFVAEFEYGANNF